MLSIQIKLFYFLIIQLVPLGIVVSFFLLIVDSLQNSYSNLSSLLFYVNYNAYYHFVNQAMVASLQPIFAIEFMRKSMMLIFQPRLYLIYKGSKALVARRKTNKYFKTTKNRQPFIRIDDQ